MTIELFDDGGNERVPLEAGALVVVPRGRWHRHVDANNLVELFHTPGESVGGDDPSTAMLRTTSENDVR